jgi:hypothetical protein
LGVSAQNFQHLGGRTDFLRPFICNHEPGMMRFRDGIEKETASNFVADRRLRKIENLINLIGSRTHDHPACMNRRQGHNAMDNLKMQSRLESNQRPSGLKTSNNYISSLWTHENYKLAKYKK